MSYGRPPTNNTRWCDKFLTEIHGQYNPDLVHFTGRLNYSKFLSVIRLSQCHVYLTVPFVLSWSLLEAMSMGLPIVASKTPPVEDLISDGNNGLLVDFFSSSDLAHAISEILTHTTLSDDLARNAKQLIIDKYQISHCVPLHLNLIQAVASGVLKSH